MCLNLSYLKTCYIIDDDESPSLPPSAIAKTDNDAENPSKPNKFRLPKFTPEHFLQHASNPKKPNHW